MDYGIPRTDHVNLGEGYNERSCDSWGRPFDEQRTELLYSGAESRHPHRNSQSATVSCQAWGVHRRSTGGHVHSREGDQSNPGRDAHHITNPRNTVPGSRPYSEVVESRTAPVTTGQIDEAVGRSTDGESAEEGTEGQPDVDSLIENNAASNPSAFDAGRMQNNADSNADHPLTSNDAVPGDALSTNATPADAASSSITAAREGNEEDAVTGMPKNDVDDSNTSRPHKDSTRVERDYEDDNPTPLLQTTEERTHTKSDSLSSPHPRSTTDHILGGETLSATSDQPQPTDTTGAASDNDGVAVGEAGHADRDEETTNDNATSNTNTRGESPTKRARAENPATSTQPEQSCHGSRTLRSDRARKPRALSHSSNSDTFKRVQVSGKSSSVTNQETDRGVSLSQAKRCSSTKR